MTIRTSDEIKTAVRDFYGQVAEAKPQAASCAPGCCSAPRGDVRSRLNSSVLPSRRRTRSAMSMLRSVLRSPRPTMTSQSGKRPRSTIRPVHGAERDAPVGPGSGRSGIAVPAPRGASRDIGGDELGAARDEHVRHPADEEPPVLLGREDRPPLVGTHDDAQDVPRRPDAAITCHQYQSLETGESDRADPEFRTRGAPPEAPHAPQGGPDEELRT